MPRYISGRSKKTPQSGLTSDRYRYLSVGEAEPNLGDPIVDRLLYGDKSSVGQQYIVVSIEGQDPGERFGFQIRVVLFLELLVSLKREL